MSYMLVLRISKILRTNNLNSADVPLRNKQNLLTVCSQRLYLLKLLLQHGLPQHEPDIECSAIIVNNYMT